MYLEKKDVPQVVLNAINYKGNRVTGITEEEWDNAKKELIEGKYLNKAGAIKPKGRNACNDLQLYQLKR